MHTVHILEAYCTHTGKTLHVPWSALELNLHNVVVHFLYSATHCRYTAHIVGSKTMYHAGLLWSKQRNCSVYGTCSIPYTAYILQHNCSVLVVYTAVCEVGIQCILHLYCISLWEGSHFMSMGVFYDKHDRMSHTAFHRLRIIQNSHLRS